MIMDENDAFQVFILDKLNKFVEEYLKSKNMLDYDTKYNIAKCFLFTVIAQGFTETDSLPAQLSDLLVFQEEVTEDFDNIRRELHNGTFKNIRKKNE